MNTEFAGTGAAAAGQDTEGCKPFIRFAGGKTQLLGDLLPLVRGEVETYFEPFVGGGAMFFALAAARLFRRAVVNDKNHELANAYRVLQERKDDLALLLRAMEEAYRKSPEAYYYELRAKLPSDLGALEAAARFIFLNKAGYNGLYRVNKSGGFNVSWGKHAEVKTFDDAALSASSRALKGVVVLNEDFEKACEGAKAGDLVYFDPPYLPKSETANFTSYTKDGFTAEDHVRLADVGRSLAHRGVRVIISNADTPLTREIYKNGYQRHEVVASRTINSVAEKRGKVWELILVGRA
jgi:DNA adenine methylase